VEVTSYFRVTTPIIEYLSLLAPSHFSQLIPSLTTPIFEYLSLSAPSHFSQLIPSHTTPIFEYLSLLAPSHFSQLFPPPSPASSPRKPPSLAVFSIPLSPALIDARRQQHARAWVRSTDCRQVWIRVHKSGDRSVSDPEKTSLIYW
jgi:hypothetical protein